MRRRLNIIGIGFVISLIVGELGIRLLTPAIPPVSSWPTVEMELKSGQLAAIGDSPDVVIIGSSISESSIDPQLLAEVTGWDMPYNAALPFSTMASNRVWLEDVVLARTSPRLVILGVPPWVPARDGEDIAMAMRDAIARDESWLTRVSALYRYRGMLADWDSLRARERLLESGLWTEVGHFTGYYEGQLVRADPWLPPSRADGLDPVSERALQAMVENARDAGARVVLLVEPVCCRVDSNASNRKYVEWLETRAEEWGVPLWNTYSNDWPADLFADSQHLNRRGTETYTRHVGALVSQSVATELGG